MSFCSDAKDKLCQINNENVYEKECEIYGFLQTSSYLKLKGLGNINLVIDIENARVARRIFSLFKDVFNVSLEIAVKKNPLKRPLYIYTLIILDKDEAFHVLDYFRIIELSRGFEINHRINFDSLTSKKDICAYLRGVFLSCGYLTSPKSKGYQLEFVLKNEDYGNDILSLLKGIEINGSIIKRKESFIVYLKDSEHIINLLALIGAHNAVLEIENTKIFRQVRNDINRRNNCDTANLDKTINSSLTQIENINYIIKRKGLDYLDRNLRELATIRLDNPEASLNEIGNMFTPKISRSTINNRFKKIEKIAHNLR